MTTELAAVWDFWATLGGVVVGLVTLIVVIMQVVLMHRQERTMEQQTALANGQLEIAERQDLLMRTQLARRADLSVFTVKVPRRVEFRTQNKGTRGARDFYRHIFVEADVAARWVAHVSGNGKITDAAFTVIGGKNYWRYSGYDERPLYPGRDTHTAYVVFRDGFPGFPTMLWQISADDGLFPTDTAYGLVDHTEDDS